MATGSPRWRRNGVFLTDTPNRIAGSSSFALALSNLTASDSGLYDCVLSGPCDPEVGLTYRVSDAVTLTICVGDFNCDGGIDGADVEFFFARCENGC